MSRQQRPTKPATEKPQAQKPAIQNPSGAASGPDTSVTVGDLVFENANIDGPLVVDGIPHRSDSRAAEEFRNAETIHASECVVNSECTLTRDCRGRLRSTNAISGKVQIYCPKCGKFAAGTRPVNGLVSGSGAKLFDRVTGK